MKINARVLGWTDKCCGCNKLIGKDEKVYIISDLLGVNGSVHLCEDCINQITGSQGIELKNIDLTGIDLEEQRRKVTEEENEFMDAFFTYTISKTDENKNQVIEELWDEFQSKLGLLEKEGIRAKEVQEYYPKHIEKLKFRPRTKKE